MSTPLWERINELFHAALVRTPEERGAFLARQCGGDSQLRLEVESLLAAHAAGASVAPPTLSAGTRLGDYEITAFIAAGAMGQVYRARDTKLGRDVALKILPAAFVSDPDRRARFEREARLLASLTHPHIATIYGFEEHAGVNALALELVEGETLADRIARRRLPVDEALRIARQIADALEAAQERGIIHRDLKPANIKLTRDGTVKVLDFGLAKLVEPASAPHGTSTLTSAGLVTGAHVLVGTPAYMSPEQARGETADQRSDIWAFGCLFYEMLTGQRAFPGESVPDTLASVLAREPRLDALPQDVPAAVRALVIRCLARDRVQRIPHASVIRFLLAETDAPISAMRGEWFARLLQHRGMRTVAIIAIFTIGATAQNVFRYFAPTRPPVLASTKPIAGGTTARFVIAPPAGQVPRRDDSSRLPLAVSPDGSAIAYIAGIGESRETGSMFLRRLDDLTSTPLPDTVDAGGPFFSPDGRSIGFATRSELKRITIGERSAMTLFPRMSGFSGAAWLPDSTIVFTTNDSTTGLLRIPAAGGQVSVLTRPDHSGGEGDHEFPSALPDGNALLFTIESVNGSDHDVAILDLRSGRYERLLRGSRAQYLPTGHLIYVDDNVVRLVRFDLASRKVVGNPFGIDGTDPQTTFLTNFAVSPAGTLAVIPTSVGSATQSLIWVDRSGREEPVGAPDRKYGVARISPDGTRAVVDVRENESDLWVWDFSRKTLRRLTFGANARNPVWMPDGLRVVFGTLSGEIMIQHVDGTGTAESLSGALPDAGIPKAMTADGKRIILSNTGSVSVLLVSEPPRTEPLVKSRSTLRNPALSPDGRWLAYDSNESGRSEVYVRPFPRVDDGRWQLSTDGAVEPLWAPGGRELFYIQGGTLKSVAVETGSGFHWADPVSLLDTRLFESSAGRRYDISPDGKRFLFMKQLHNEERSSTGDIVVVTNWFEELKRLLPAK